MKLAALTIGQSPRPDLVDPLPAAFPRADIVEAGALDGVSAADLPSAAGEAFPLVTRLRDDTPITISQSFLEPLLQRALERLEAAGVDVSILLCAGTFSSLAGTKPLIKPFDAARTHLNELGVKRLGLIAPIAAQITPLEHRWRGAGFDPVAWAADVNRPDEVFAETLRAHVQQYHLEAILLDYVGHSVAVVAQAAALSPVPLFDSGRLAIEALANVS